jgi:hypothetical protein
MGKIRESLSPIEIDKTFKNFKNRLGPKQNI